MEEQESQENGTGTASIGCDKAKQIAVVTEWHLGTRSAGWDELWRRIFSDLFTKKGGERPCPKGKERTYDGP